MELQHLLLYQPDRVLKERLPGGAAVLAALVESVCTQLDQPEFDPTCDDDRAVVLAVRSDGAVRGWVCSKSGVILPGAQASLDAVLETLVAPQVVGGLLLIAIVYSVSGPPPPDEPWLPMPDQWREAAQATRRPLNVEVLVDRVLAD